MSEYVPLLDRLRAQAPSFDFFQAVRLLERAEPNRVPVGVDGPPRAEVVRFSVHQSLSFPVSTIHKLEVGADVPPLMTVNFLGLTGASGVLPRHYTELLERILRETDNPERFVLRDWLDLFNHRFISLFYRAWTKYRYWLAYDRGEHEGEEPDPFTRTLFSVIGLGTGGLRQRLHLASHEEIEGRRTKRMLTHIDDFALLHYAGLLSHQPANASGLEGMLEDYFALPICVMQLQGQWLQLTPENQTRLGEAGHNNALGTTALAGTRVWDVESKIMLRVGPLAYDAFLQLLPDRSATSERKRFFLMVQMARYYVGAQFQLDVQLVLKRDAVPEFQLPMSTADGPQLGWNTWLVSQSVGRDPDETIFAGEESTRLG
jgi:type VI secretion system protein ImpH